MGFKGLAPGSRRGFLHYTASRPKLDADCRPARKLANRSAVLDLSGPQQQEQAKPPKGLNLTYQEVTALEAAISSATLSDSGWSLDDTGRVTTDAGQIVFRAGFASAIRKTVDYVADF